MSHVSETTAPGWLLVSPRQLSPRRGPAWYQALGDLRLPDGCRFAAGFVHEALDLDANRTVLGLVEDADGAQVTVATSCGLGRRPDPGQVPDALEKMAALAAAKGEPACLPAAAAVMA